MEGERTMGRRMRLWPQVTSLWILVALVALLLAPATSAQGVPVQEVQDRRVLSQGQGPTDPQELEAFVDASLGEQMGTLHIPGAVFVLVKDGEVLLAKGYGYADLENRKPVLPEETLFAVGSVAKVFTASAVMQLAERGLLDLHGPVNDYLKDFQIGENCSEPVTTAHLLTHTAGLDERLTGVYFRALEDLIPLKEYVAERLPPCIRPPGQEMSYCNHCYGLAGYLVEEISGMPFEQYVEDEIFQPLGMDHSSFRQPLPPELAARRAVGYIFTPEHQSAETPYSPLFPSGSLYTTGADMAQFMIAQLEGASGGDARILEAGTVREMQRRQFAQHPRLEGWTYGFFEYVENGQRAIEKGGDITGFSSLLFLLPEEQLGFFLAFNATVGVSQGFADPREELPSLFLDRYFPVQDGSVSAHPSGETKHLAGKYRWTRYAHTTIDKALAPLSFLQWRVTANNDGTITLAYPSLLGGRTTRWAEVEPLLFRDLEGDAYLTVRQDEKGRVTHLYVTTGEEGVLERVPWYETDTVQLALIGFLLLAFLSVLVWPAGSLIRSLRGQREHPGRVSTWSRVLAGLLGVLNLIFLFGLGMGIGYSMRTMAPEIPAYFAALLVIPLVTGALAVVVLALTVVAWRRHTWSFGGRLHYSLVTLSGWLFLWFASYWNLLGFRF
jgi:CubicO group peptidase (beta-lactamase class C family)